MPVQILERLIVERLWRLRRTFYSTTVYYFLFVALCQAQAANTPARPSCLRQQPWTNRGKSAVELDKGVLKKIQDIQKLNPEDKAHVFALLDAFLQSQKAKKVFTQ